MINAILPKGSIDLDGGPPSDTNPSLLFDVFGSVEGLTIIPLGPKEILVSPLTELYMPGRDPNAPNKLVVGFPLMKKGITSPTPSLAQLADLGKSPALVFCIHAPLCGKFGRHGILGDIYETNR